VKGVTILGYGDDAGGCQWVVFENEVSGAKVALSGGFDYGSWISRTTIGPEWAGEINEQELKSLMLWNKLNYNERSCLVQYFKDKYP